MKAIIPNLSQATGEVGGRAYPEGDYTFDITKGTYEKPTEDNPNHGFVFESVIVDGPNREDGTTTIGGKFTHRFYIMTPDHPKFKDDTATFQMNKLVNLCNAVDYKIKKDGIDAEALVGTTACGTMVIEEGEYKGKKTRNNKVVRYFKADTEGEIDTDEEEDED